MTDQAKPKPTLEKCLTDYAKFEATRQEYTEALKLIEAAQVRIRLAVLEFMNETKQTATKTPFGNVEKKIKVLPSAENWDTFYDWVFEDKDRIGGFLERRIKKTSIQEYMDAHEGALPPGVRVYREAYVNITPILKE